MRIIGKKDEKEEVDRLASIGKEVQDILIKHECSVFDAKIICKMVCIFANEDLKTKEQERHDEDIDDFHDG